MLSDKEKKAIERFKNFIYTYQDVIEDEYSDYEEKESAKEYQEVSEKILNLIEKQSKEIEELKEVKWYYEISRVPKDKIKAKIEEYENKIKKIRSKKIINEPEDTIIITRYAHYISVLQSLLEKE